MTKTEFWEKLAYDLCCQSCPFSEECPGQEDSPGFLAYDFDCAKQLETFYNSCTSS